VLEHRVEIGRVDQVIAAEDLLRLGERPVGDLHLTAALAERGCGLDALESVAADEQPGVLELLRVRLPALVHLGRLPGRTAVGRRVDQHQVVGHRWTSASVSFPY